MVGGCFFFFLHCGVCYKSGRMYVYIPLENTSNSAACIEGTERFTLPLHLSYHGNIYRLPLEVLHPRPARATNHLQIPPHHIKAHPKINNTKGTKHKGLPTSLSLPQSSLHPYPNPNPNFADSILYPVCLHAWKNLHM